MLLFICLCADLYLDLVSNPSAESLLEDCDLFGPTRDDVLSMAVKMANVLDEPGPDLRDDLPKGSIQHKKDDIIAKHTFDWKNALRMTSHLLFLYSS